MNAREALGMMVSASLLSEVPADVAGPALDLLERLVDAVDEILKSPAEYDEPRLQYLTLQVDRSAWMELKAAMETDDA